MTFYRIWTAFKTKIIKQLLRLPHRRGFPPPGRQSDLRPPRRTRFPFLHTLRFHPIP